MPRPLDAREIRVLGSLLEKEQATPEYYPLTLNALVAACNQKSNRYPVLSLSERDVGGALERLLQADLVAREETSRAVRWKHKLDWRLNLNAPRKAALTVLLLRGSQTAGEVRARSSRLHEFASADEAEVALADLAAPPDPLVMLLEREPGQKEPRWEHQLGAPGAATDDVRQAASSGGEESPPAAQELDPEQVLVRLRRLEQQVQELQATVRRLRGASD